MHSEARSVWRGFYTVPRNGGTVSAIAAGFTTPSEVIIGIGGMSMAAWDVALILNSFLREVIVSLRSLDGDCSRERVNAPGPAYDPNAACSIGVLL